MRRTETPEPIWIKFGVVVDVVTYTNFGDNRLRGFRVAGVKFPPLPLTFIVALTTLPCERVKTDTRVTRRVKRCIIIIIIP